MTDIYDKTQGAELTTGSPAENPNTTENLTTPDLTAGNSQICPGCNETGAEDMDGAIAIKCARCNGIGHVSNSRPGTLRHFSMGSLLLRPEYLSEDLCRERISRLLNPIGPRCPACGWTPAWAFEGPFIDRFYSGERCVCKKCNREFTAKTDTFLQGTHLSFAQVFLLAVLIDIMQSGLTPARIAEILGVSVDTVRNWILRFKAFEGHE